MFGPSLKLSLLSIDAFHSFLSIAIYVFIGYLLLGLIFGLFFVFSGVQQMDEAAQGSSWGFRLLIFPGAVALWIFLLPKWIKSRKA